MTISLTTNTYPSLEEDLICHEEESAHPLIKLNPKETLDNKMSMECHRHGMIETKTLPMDIHETSTLELEREDVINEHGSYFMAISLTPYFHEKSPKSILLSAITIHEIYNPFMLLVPKIFAGMIVDAFVYHKYCKSHSCFGMSLVDRSMKVGVEGETTSST